LLYVNNIKLLLNSQIFINMKINEILLETLGIPFPNRRTVTIINDLGEEIRVECEIPTTDEEKNQGLMYRDNLGKNNGMFYDYTHNGFWMKDVLIPLEMIFIDGDEIVEIVDAKPKDTTIIKPSLPADANLEVNKDFCQQNNISVGNKIYKS